MRVMHIITQSELGGAQSVVLNLANYFASLEGFEVYVVSGGPGDAWKGLTDKVKVIYIKESVKQVGWKDLIVWFKLLKIRMKYKPDVVHLHSSKAGVLGRLAFPRKKIIYTVHGFDSIRVAFRQFLPLEKILKNHARHIVGVSKYDVANLAKEGISSVCIYNGITDSSIAPQKDDDLEQKIEIVNHLKLKKQFIVLCIARYAKPKRYDLFCQVADSLSKENISFVWVGNQLVPDYIPDNVYCLGEISDAHRLIAYADLFMLPSDYEGLPISVIEALSYRKPVVASDVGGIKEILDGSNGFVVPNHPGAFAEKIQLYKTDKKMYELSSLAARKSYLEHFTIEIMCNQYKTLYI
ncbi:glycosyl transferase [Bacteroidia bacterium]|nr:glycosyl transferase [Bacteroidia bacterium]